MNYEFLCEVLLEVLQEYRTQLQKLQSGFGHTNSQVEILQSINNGLLSELEELQEHNKELQKKIEAEKIFNAYYTELQHERDQLIREIEDRKFNYGVLENEHTNLLLHRNSLQAENNKLILERDQLQTDCERLVADREQLRDNTSRLAKGWDDCENKLKGLQKTNPKDTKALKKLQEELQDTKSKLQLAQIAYNENRKLIAERDELKARLESDQEFVRISKEESLNIRREFDRVSAERDQVQSELNTARDIIRRMRDEMKQRGIIAVIDDSIVREEPK